MLSENTTLLFSAKSKCPFTLCPLGISQNRRACCGAGLARKKQQSEGQPIVYKTLQDSTRTILEIKSKLQTFLNIQSERIVCDRVQYRTSFSLQEKTQAQVQETRATYVPNQATDNVATVVKR